jgi:hypothetical protein
MGVTRATIGEVLDQELDLWRLHGLVARFWWRDDDAQFENDPFDRLLDLAASVAAPLVLAVSPLLMKDGFVSKLRRNANIRVAAHGYKHVNHRKQGPKSEFGPDRPLDEMRREIDELAAVFALRFPEHGLAMFFPPWHGLDPRLIPDLKRVGFKVLSLHESRLIRATRILAAQLPTLHFAFARTHRGQASSQRGLARVDVSVNVLHGGPSGPVLNRGLTQHVLGGLRVRRLGVVPVGRPIGILTHHLQHDEATWEQLSQLVATVARHPAASFVQSKELCSDFIVHDP